MSRSTMPPLSWHTFLSTWHPHAVPLLVCALLLTAYVVGGWMAVRRGTKPVSAVRVASFALGVIALAVCLSSAVNAYAMSLFWMHMIEHLTLIMMVPALLVLGHPLSVMRAAGGDHWSGGFDRVMHSLPLSILTHPFVGMALYALVIFYTHLTPFMDQMVAHPWLMGGEQTAYVVSGWLMLLPLIGEEPIRWHTPYLLRLALLIVAMIPDTFVGIILLQTEKSPFPTYMSMRPRWATPPLHDLQIGGSLMWSAGDGLMMCLCIGLVITLISGRTRDRVLGSWLESIRTSTFVDHVERSGGNVDPQRPLTIDDDEASLDAYNDMLRRLNRSD